MPRSYGTPVNIYKRRRTWDRATGERTEELYKGRESAINALISRAKKVSEGFEQDHDGASHYLTVRYASDEAQIETRLVGSRVTLDIRWHPNFVNIEQMERRRIDEAMQNPADYVDRSPALTDPDAINLYILLTQGVRHYISYQPTLFRTVTSSDRYAWDINYPAAYDDVGAVFTTNEVVIDSLVGNHFGFALPRDISPSPDFAYGWLKQYPELTAIAGSKRQLSQDYVYGLWALGVYNLV